MENSIEQSTVPEQRRKSLTAPVVALLLPVALMVPYWWFVFRYARDSICTPRIGQEHQGVHVFFFWIMTYFPFSVVCFLSSVVMLIQRTRQDSRARPLLVFACLCSLGAVSLLALLLFA